MSIDELRKQLSTTLAGQKLFLKIFFWFLMTVIGIVASIFVAPRLTPYQVVVPPNVNAVVAPILAAQAVKAYEAGGSSGFAHFAQQNTDDQGRKLYLLNGMYQDVLNRGLPEHGYDVAKRTRAGQLIVFRSTFAAYRYISTNGRPYVLLLFLNKGVGKLVTQTSRKQAFFYLSMLLVMSVPCFWLARHIASPMLELQDAAQRVAAGDLKARAPRKLLARHDELRDLSADFNTMVDRIEALVQTHKRLLASVSHETRSPLTRLALATALLRRYEQPETSALLDRLDREVATMDVLMGQLLTLARLEEGVHREKTNTVDITSLVEGVVADANFEADTGQPRVQFRSPLAVWIEAADGVALRSALDNIVRNALRYTPASSSVEVELYSNSEGASEQATIVVCDAGPGVPEEYLEAIFQPFFRVHSEAEGARSGNGLGLTIASEAIHLHGGNIKATNRRNGGLQVEINLPVRPCERIASRRYA